MQKKALILASLEYLATFFPKLSFDDSFLASPDHANAPADEQQISSNVTLTTVSMGQKSGLPYPGVHRFAAGAAKRGMYVNPS
jgi:hypothetical protein